MANRNSKLKSKKDKPKGRVYSYLRFSTPEQAFGDSERRQVDMAKAWAERNNLELDNTLDLTDRGLSGYHGHHRTKGRLGFFLAAVESGRVPTGSILLIENIDRLSREGAVSTLRNIVFNLWDKEITIQTLSPEESYPPGCDNDPRFIGLFFYLQRAQNESKEKSTRIRESRDIARERARKERKILTKQCPAWLTVVGKDEAMEFEPIPEAVNAINMIFDLKLQGIGKETIARKLNAEAHWAPPGRGGKPTGWRGSYIAKILSYRAVLGEYQPYALRDEKRRPIGDPIPGYYPPIVDAGVFHAVQEQFKLNGQHNGGRTGKVRNLFTHIIKCPYCGGSMAYIDKGKPPRGGQYLVCDKSRRGLGCGRWSDRSIRYHEVEDIILNNCRHLNPAQVLPNPDEQAQLCRSLGEKLAGKMAAREDINRRLDNLTDQLANEDSRAIRQRLRDKMNELDHQQSGLESEIADAETALTHAEQARRSFSKWKKELSDLRDKLDDPEFRLRLRIHLRELIERIDVYTVGFPKLHDPYVEIPHPVRVAQTADGRQRVSAKRRLDMRPNDVEDLAETIIAQMTEYDPKWQPDTKFNSFLTDLTRRRMTKEGRFIRIHFKTGATVDIALEGSLASGMELTRDGRKNSGWRFVNPDIERLWSEFKVKG